VPDTSIANFLFHLPEQSLNREEKIQVLKRALAAEEEIRDGDLDEMLGRLLKELQN